MTLPFPPLFTDTKVKVEIGGRTEYYNLVKNGERLGVKWIDIK